MDTMKERITQVRTALGLSKVELARRVGADPSSITRYESGESGMSRPTVTNFCRELGVSEAWLRDGTGTMFDEAADPAVEAMLASFNLNPRERKLILDYLKLDQQGRVQAEDYLNYLVMRKEERGKE